MHWECPVNSCYTGLFREYRQEKKSPGSLQVQFFRKYLLICDGLNPWIWRTDCMCLEKRENGLLGSFLEMERKFDNFWWLSILEKWGTKHASWSPGLAQSGPRLQTLLTGTVANRQFWQRMNFEIIKQVIILFSMSPTYESPSFFSSIQGRGNW